MAVKAEARRLTVLHYDNEFDAIAKLTGQPVRWVVPAGTACPGRQGVDGALE